MRRILLALLLLQAVAARGAIRGVVVDQNGAPVAAASIAAYAQETREDLVRRITGEAIDREPLAHVASAADGSFRIDTAGRPVVELVIGAPGRELLAFDAAEGDDLGARMLRTRKPLTGRVTAAGKPVGGAVVVLDSGAAVTRTNEQGAFTLPATSGTARVAVLHPGYAPLEKTIEKESALDFALDAGVEIRGRVIAPNGRTAVSNARIFGGSWLLGSTKEDGTFVLAHAPSRWRTIRVASSHGGAIVPNSGAKSYEVKLRPPAAHTGTVRDTKTNDPVAGVRYRIAYMTDEGVAESVITGAKGEVSFQGLAPGRYAIYATHPLYAVSSNDMMLALEPSEIDDGMHAATPLATIRGRVVDEGKKPVGGVTITRAAAFRRVPITVTSAPDGTFMLRSAADPSLELQASRQGFAPASIRTAVAAGETKKVDITLIGGIPLEIEVRDRDDAPVAGATVLLMNAGSRRGFSRPLAACGADACLTGADGRIAVRVAAAEYDLTVTGPDVVTRQLTGQAIDERTSPLKVVVDRGVEVSGQALFSDGTPAAGARIILAPESPNPGSAVADEQGAFAFLNAARGPVALVAHLPKTPTVTGKAEVAAPATGVRITIPRGGGVTGRVSDAASREPIADFNIQVVQDHWPMPPVPFASDDGSFVLEDIPTGEVTLQGLATGYALATAKIQVAEGKTVSDVELPLQRAARIRGRVTSKDGQPLSGGTVSVRESGVHAGARVMVDRGLTDGNGEYALTNVLPGERTLVFDKPGYVSAEKTVQAAGGKEMRVDATLDAGRTVRGRITDEQGRPLSDVTVTANGPAGWVPGGRTDSDGAFVLQALAAQEYRVQAARPGFISAVETLDAATSDTMTIVLRRGATVTGRVTGLAVEQFPHVSVSASGERMHETGSVDAEGAFRIGGMPDGKVRVQASIVAGSVPRTVHKEIEVVNGSVPAVELAFTDGLTVQGRVTAGGEPLAQAHVVFVSSEPGVTATGVQTTPAGTFAVAGLVPGEYDVSITSRTGANYFREKRSISGGAPVEIEIRGSAVRGRVIDASQQTPVADAVLTLEASEPTADVHQTSSDSGGRFTFGFVPAGTWTLRVQKETYRSSPRQVVITSALPEQEVRLERGSSAALRVVDALTGQPLASYFILADGADQMVFEGETHATDTAAQAWAAPGQYTVTVFRIGYVTTTATVLIPGPEVRIALQPGGRIRVQSRRGAQSRLTAGRSTMQSTNNEYDSLAPGDYLIELLDASQRVIDKRTVTVVAGQTVTVVFD